MAPLDFFGMHTETDVVAAFSSAALALGTCGAAMWAAFTYYKSRELEAARWQKQIFDSLFLSGKFDTVRLALDHDFDKALARKIELSAQDYDDLLAADDRKLLLELDNFLNLLEYLLYLEQDRKQVDANDRHAIFGYWIDLFKSPPYAAIRHYASHYGYERVAALIGAGNDTLLILYGSLRRGQPKYAELGLDKALEFVTECEFTADLYDLGQFPGAVPGTRKASGQLYKVVDRSIFTKLDAYEEFNRAAPGNSLYVRRCVHVPNLGDAWVYWYNRPVTGRKIVASGKWYEKKRRPARKAHAKSRPRGGQAPTNTVTIVGLQTGLL